MLPEVEYQCGFFNPGRLVLAEAVLLSATFRGTVVSVSGHRLAEAAVNDRQAGPSSHPPGSWTSGTSPSLEVNARLSVAGEREELFK